MMPFASPIAAAPPTRIRPFRGPQTTIDTMRELCLGARGERSMLVRNATEYVTRGLQPKDYFSEIIAVRNFVAEKVRYANDPVGLEAVKDGQRLIEEIQAHGLAVGDCDDICLLIATMCRQLGRQSEFITVGFGVPNHFSHVFARVLEPKSGKWLVTDPVAGGNEARMLSRVTTWKAWRID
jgi:transglutaminase-like putative cysteine protease